jgi:hypothetical protein
MSDTDTYRLTIALGGESATLQPSLRAAEALSTKFGGLMNVFPHLAAYDLEAYVDVVAIALGRSGDDERATIKAGVYATGGAELVGPLTRYVGSLMNGGRAPKSEAS